MTRRATGLMLVGVMLLLGAPARGADAPDLSAPKSAVTAFERAAQNGDIAGAKAASVSDDANQQLVETFGRLNAVSTKFREALTAKFGADAAKGLAGPDPKTLDLDQEMSKAEVSEQGDTATVTTVRPQGPSTRVVRKNNGQWRVDVVATLQREPRAAAVMGNPALVDALTRTTQELTDELNQGKYKSVNEVQGAMMGKVRSMMAQQKPATAPASPATQPGR